MRAGSNEYQPVFFRFPNQQPVRLYVALSVLGPIPPQLVGPMSRLKWVTCKQLVNN